MTAIHAHPTDDRRASQSQYRNYRFTYLFDGAEWSIEIPALSLAEAKQRVHVLGFARYEAEARPGEARPRHVERHTASWFRKALRSAA